MKVAMPTPEIQSTKFGSIVVNGCCPKRHVRQHQAVHLRHASSESRKPP